MRLRWAFYFGIHSRVGLCKNQDMYTTVHRGNLSLTDEITTIDKDNLSSGLIRQADGSVGLMS